MGFARARCEETGGSQDGGQRPDRNPPTGPRTTTRSHRNSPGTRRLARHDYCADARHPTNVVAGPLRCPIEHHPLLARRPDTPHLPTSRSRPPRALSRIPVSRGQLDAHSGRPHQRPCHAAAAARPLGMIHETDCAPNCAPPPPTHRCRRARSRTDRNRVRRCRHQPNGIRADQRRSVRHNPLDAGYPRGADGGHAAGGDRTDSSNDDPAGTSRALHNAARSHALPRRRVQP
jgi:hypothetical protein